MAYDKDFYKAYREYLREPSVRSAHDWVFSFFRYHYDGEQRREVTYKYDNVVDLGCGQCHEFNIYYDPWRYTGIDENTISAYAGNERLIRGNYRNREFLKSLVDSAPPISPNATAFVSLFSSEITAPYKENYHLYNWIFANFPNIRAGLVSGFYYTNKLRRNPVKEAGGVVSYQTLERIEDCNRKGYTERRIALPVPSKMFGDKVVEVWKIFQRTS